MTKNLLALACLLLFACFTAAAQKLITGKIVDESGGVLPGVNVLLKGTTTGTVSGADGSYSLSVPEDRVNSGVLVFSFIGYTAQEHVIGSRTVIDISLLPDVSTLNEVVVVGYGTMRREDISGAVSSVQTKDLPKVANTSIDQLLQGRVAGLNMAQRSAQPGGGLNINIRGAISPQGSNQPLYVIDGVPIFNNSSPEQNLTGGGQLGYGGGVDRNPLNSLNPSDIESIDVLKDASATAIYGSSAANGVVLITTKRGQTGPAQVEYRGSYTVQTVKDYIDLFTGKEFMQHHNRLANDRYLILNNLAPYGTTDPATVDPFVPTFSNHDIQAIAGKGTDWLDLLIRNGSIHEHNVSISGGNENTKYYSAFNFFDNEAILENSNLRRYTGRVNVDQKLGGRITLGLNLTGSQINSTNISSGSNSGGTEKYNMLQAAYAYSPTVGIFDESGAYTKSLNRLITNPAAFLIMDDNSISRRLMASPNLEVKILDELKLNIVGGIDQQNSQRNFYIPKAVDNFNFPNGAAQKYNSNIGNYSSEAYFTFSKSTGSNNLNIVAGGGIYKNVTSMFGIEAVDFFTDALRDDNIGIATAKDRSSFISNRTERNRQSLFSRINYSFNDKYIVTLSGRYDGDSEFAANKKFGFFPGASVAWRISGEDFMANSELVSEMKLRVGFGRAGNPLNAGSAIQTLGLNPDPQVQNRFNYPTGGVVYSGVTVLQLENPNLTWETNETINVGLDFGFWDNKVSGAIDVYQRTAKDLLDFNQLPYNNAIGQVSTNIGTTRSQGVELSITTVNLTGPLSWSTTLNATTFKSFWVERNQSRPLNPWVKENDPISAVYGWRTAGIIQSNSEIPAHMTDANYPAGERVGDADPGNIQFVDVSGDGKLNADDVVMLGQRAPKWNLGMANTFSYKNFDLNFFLYGMMGHIASINSIGAFNNASPGDRLAATDTQNTPSSIARVWTADNPDGDLPGLAPNRYAGKNPATNREFDNNDFYVQKADFVRLKNITLGYTFSRDLLSSKLIRSARIFVDVQNLAKFTEFDGFDPEFTEINPYPQAVSTTVGVNLGF